jgi:hypothetical protein
MADLTSIINSIVSRDQQAVATVLTSSTLSQPQSTTTFSPGSIPNPIPIPSATHISHSVGASAQVQKSSISKQKESIMHMSMAIPSLGDLCKSLGVNISKETPSFRASIPATTFLSTTPASTASLLPTMAVGKTERGPTAPSVMDQATAPKLDSSVSTVPDRKAVVVSDAGSLQQQPARVIPAVQLQNKPSLTEALSVNRGTELPASSVSGVSDEAKKLLESADSVGKPGLIIPNSFLAAIQLQPTSPQKSPTQASGSPQPQTTTAPPQKTLTQSLPSSGGSGTSLAPSAPPASVAGSAISKNTPLQTRTNSSPSSVQASISQSQISTPKAILVGSLSAQKQHAKTVSTADVTPAVATPTTTKSSAATVSRQIPTPPAANTSTPPTATPTTTSVGTSTKSQQQAATGSSVQINNSSAATATTPKDINLPILQFLQANFPALQLGALSAGGGGASGSGKGKKEGGGGDGSNKEVLQVQTLLAHVLQQQHQLQQLQQQAQQQVQKAIASGQPLAAPGNNGKAKSSLYYPTLPYTCIPYITFITLHYQHYLL